MHTRVVSKTDGSTDGRPIASHRRPTASSLGPLLSSYRASKPLIRTRWPSVLSVDVSVTALKNSKAIPTRHTRHAEGVSGHPRRHTHAQRERERAAAAKPHAACSNRLYWWAGREGVLRREKSLHHALLSHLGKRAMAEGFSFLRPVYRSSFAFNSGIFDGPQGNSSTLPAAPAYICT